jgi:hypothetical protein
VRIKESPISGSIGIEHISGGTGVLTAQ